MQFVKVDSFDGVHLMGYNQMDINRFGLLYATFFGAALDSTALLPHPDRYMRAKDSLGLDDAIPLSVFNLDYHRFKKNAVDLNLIYVQDQSTIHLTGIPTNSLHAKPWVLQFVQKNGRPSLFFSNLENPLLAILQIRKNQRHSGLCFK